MIQCEIDYTIEVQSATGRDPESVVETKESSNITVLQFVTKYFTRVFLASCAWLIFNVVFFGLIILIDQPTKVIGFNKGIFLFSSDFSYLSVSLCTIILCVSLLSLSSNFFLNNSGNIWQPAAEECLGLAVGYLTVCLVALIPGFYVTVLTVDVIGRKIIQFFGFILMAVWCSSCAGSYNFLTYPNKNKDAHTNTDGPKG